MVTPKKGDYPGIPLNAEGRKIADAWDPAKDEAGGDQCKAYSAPAIMRVPGRLHIAWQDANTLRMDTDAGTQTRLFHFSGSTIPSGAATWQGIPRRGGSWYVPRYHRTRLGPFTAGA
jgi:hypothetical protein